MWEDACGVTSRQLKQQGWSCTVKYVSRPRRGNWDKPSRKVQALHRLGAAVIAWVWYPDIFSLLTLLAGSFMFLFDLGLLKSLTSSELHWDIQCKIFP